MYWLGFTFTEAMNLPMTYKRWYIERLTKELEKKGPSGETVPSKAPHQMTQEARQLMGHARDQSPARLRRFT